ncbi:tRNA (adenosine(37)-N6)-threonylcarbamoyltransferase complex dimerization subunit type 1 TsaB [Pseudoduganella buxea]|uniref:tRNA (Adenosine(37)-N6)-threonylcarbamoyltransferase complex dimerization subunit type 1 TsaB n=4 Tax=Pseudoduganella buxea TaxID=1949069 RepID=A0ABQ1LKL3_9BURK|nr:tRNA (adenosine(37)-N6)-threonylcarbamoyltransferase complex dimerization subunit type 1 TsaB [Pseudoduganella buxea]
MASCALLCDGRVTYRESSGVRTHSQSVLPMIQELLAEAGIALADCDAIAFGAGPGSFTGVRTACGIAQGLGFGAGKPLVPVVTLAAMALACREQQGGDVDAVLPVLDARMNEVYWAQYRFDGDLPVAVLPPALSAPGDVAAQGEAVACGNGFTAYPEGFAPQLAAAAHGGAMPHAAQVARLGAAALAAGQGVPAGEAQPLYLRNKVAYTKAERADINEAAAIAATAAAAAAGAAA